MDLMQLLQGIGMPQNGTDPRVQALAEYMRMMQQGGGPGGNMGSMMAPENAGQVGPQAAPYVTQQGRMSPYQDQLERDAEDPEAFMTDEDPTAMHDIEARKQFGNIDREPGRNMSRFRDASYSPTDDWPDTVAEYRAQHGHGPATDSEVDYYYGEGASEPSMDNPDPDNTEGDEDGYYTATRDARSDPPMPEPRRPYTDYDNDVGPAFLDPPLGTLRRGEETSDFNRGRREMNRLNPDQYPKAGPYDAEDERRVLSDEEELNSVQEQMGRPKSRSEESLDENPDDGFTGDISQDSDTLLRMRDLSMQKGGEHHLDYEAFLQKFADEYGDDEVDGLLGSGK